MAEAEFYVYVHRRADSGEVFYVGKGRGKRAWSRHQRSEFWKSIVAKHGFTAHLVEEGLPEAKAFEQERALIAFYRAASMRLANFTDGGEGISGYRYSEEEKVKSRLRQIEIQNRPEVKAKKSASLSKALKGKKFTPERRAAMSERLKGKPLPEAHRLALIGKIITAEHRAALKAANARPGVRERRSAAISATMKGYVKSDEHRAALSAAAKADWARRKAAKQNTSA